MPEGEAPAEPGVRPMAASDEVANTNAASARPAIPVLRRTMCSPGPIGIFWSEWTIYPIVDYCQILNVTAAAPDAGNSDLWRRSSHTKHAVTDAAPKCSGVEAPLQDRVVREI